MFLLFRNLITPLVTFLLCLPMSPLEIKPDKSTEPKIPGAKVTNSSMGPLL